MKHQILSSLSVGIIALGAVLGSAIPISKHIKELEKEVAVLKEKRPDKSYKFKVNDYVIATLTSEPQEITHDMRLAHCISNKNECYIEVQINDNRRILELIHTGYEITYTLERTLNKTVSNHGWFLA